MQYNLHFVKQFLYKLDWDKYTNWNKNDINIKLYQG